MKFALHTFSILLLCMLFTSTAVGASPQAGAESLQEYLPLLQGKRVALTAHHASRVGDRQLLDVLLEKNVNVVKVFTPEHGLAGTAGAGEEINNSQHKTGIPILSLYGKRKKPSAKELKDVQVMIFDLQDVGVRCYTYSSTLLYIMEACAQSKIPLILLDRPNPNGHFVDGPVLDMRYSSFIGLLPVPFVHGMTLGELAQMINGERWLSGGKQCELKVIRCKQYTHKSRYVVSIAPSPNLPNMRAIYMYPSLAFFEGTIMSVGRGTDLAFQVVGHPLWTAKKFEFTPHKNIANKDPVYVDKICRGIDFSTIEESVLFAEQKINLRYLLEAYSFFGKGFFNQQFNYVAGVDVLRRQIESGMEEAEIRKSWSADLARFLETRKKYLLYPNFE
jgi:uncharacterized protein YbbC (DUF1343 family)